MKKFLLVSAMLAFAAPVVANDSGISAPVIRDSMFVASSDTCNFLVTITNKGETTFDWACIEKYASKYRLDDLNDQSVAWAKLLWDARKFGEHK